jgi:hypothetical protein
VSDTRYNINIPGFYLSALSYRIAIYFYYILNLRLSRRRDFGKLSLVTIFKEFDNTIRIRISLSLKWRLRERMRKLRLRQCR